jgi:hypothetical protein
MDGQGIAVKAIDRTRVRTAVLAGAGEGQRHALERARSLIGAGRWEERGMGVSSSPER